jgi:hypothetical protein
MEHCFLSTGVLYMTKFADVESSQLTWYSFPQEWQDQKRGIIGVSDHSLVYLDAVFHCDSTILFPSFQTQFYLSKTLNDLMGLLALRYYVKQIDLYTCSEAEKEIELFGFLNGTQTCFQSRWPLKDLSFFHFDYYEDFKFNSLLKPFCNVHIEDFSGASFRFFINDDLKACEGKESFQQTYILFPQKKLKRKRTRFPNVPQLHLNQTYTRKVPLNGWQ